MKKRNTLFAIIFYIISILSIGIYIIIEINSSLHSDTIPKILFLSLFTIFSFLGTHLISKIYNKPKLINIMINVYFIIYMCVLLYLTIFIRAFYSLKIYDIQNYINYTKHSLNLIPFKTIIEFITNFFVNNERSNSELLISNIFGNIIAFMPLAFFIPYKFKRINNLKNFFITITIFVVSIEILQFITLTGICDIDDLILNVSGACLMYIILKKINIEKTLCNKI